MNSRRLGVRAAVVDGSLLEGDVSIRDGRIEAVALAPAPAAGGVAVPGFVDSQVNGFGGVDFRASGPADLGRAADVLAREGVVWAAPTLFDSTEELYCGGLAAIGEFRRANPMGGLLGAHLEGPNLAEGCNGAHDPANFAPCDTALVQRLASAGPVAMVTLAPELPGAMEVIRTWRSLGAVVGIGHTDADAATCRRARAEGASALTHCWNAHRRLGARDPGPAGWALASPGVVVGLIADGFHVAPEVIALTFAAAPGRVAVTSDAVAAAGTGTTGEPLRTPDGRLAGSTAVPTRMIRVLEACGVSFVDAVRAMSVPQSSLLGLTANELRPGQRADVTVLAEDRTVLSCWRSGERVG